MKFTRLFLTMGALFGFLAVALGAFGAHALKTKLAPEMLTIFETGVRYQMYHSLALIMIELLSFNLDQKAYRFSGWCFLTGILIFSGSLYTLSLSGVKTWGAVTPIGGLAFLLGWGSLLWASLKSTQEDH